MDVRLTAPPAVRWIAGTLERAGFETWAVGGAVRDILLGVDSGDWDLATRARPGQVRRLFRRTVPIGIEHGTVGVLARDGTLYEITTFRRDVVPTGRHALVEFADRLEEDLARRDFTINAIAWHPLRGELKDPFGGVQDLEARILRTVEEPERRFAEDYLRVLRALRFAGRFDLEIEAATWRALVAAAGALDALSRERVREELMKVLAGDARPSRALDLYRVSGALEAVAPELAATVGVPLPEPVPGLDTWGYGVAVAEALTPRRPLLRLTALLQGVGLPGSDGRDWQPGASRERAAQLMVRLRFSNAQVQQVTALLAPGPLPPGAEVEGAALRRWLSRTGARWLPDLARMWIARARVLLPQGKSDARATRAAWRALRAELRARPPLSVADLALDGRDLIRMGMKPGPRFRAVLDDLLERVLEDPSLNEPDALAAVVHEKWGTGEKASRERAGRQPGGEEAGGRPEKEERP